MHRPLVYSLRSTALTPTFACALQVPPVTHTIVLPGDVARVKVLVGAEETVAMLEKRLCAQYDADRLVEGRQMIPLDGARLVSTVEGQLWLKVLGRGGGDPDTLRSGCAVLRDDELHVFGTRAVHSPASH